MTTLSAFGSRTSYATAQKAVAQLSSLTGISAPTNCFVIEPPSSYPRPQISPSPARNQPSLSQRRAGHPRHHMNQRTVSGDQWNPRPFSRARPPSILPRHPKATSLAEIRRRQGASFDNNNHNYPFEFAHGNIGGTPGRGAGRLRWRRSRVRLCAGTLLPNHVHLDGQPNRVGRCHLQPVGHQLRKRVQRLVRLGSERHVECQSGQRKQLFRVGWRLLGGQQYMRGYDVGGPHRERDIHRQLGRWR
jgi:hypothetical protein